MYEIFVLVPEIRQLLQRAAEGMENMWTDRESVGGCNGPEELLKGTGYSQGS